MSQDSAATRAAYLCEVIADLELPSVRVVLARLADADAAEQRAVLTYPVPEYKDRSVLTLAADMLEDGSPPPWHALLDAGLAALAALLAESDLGASILTSAAWWRDNELVSKIVTNGRVDVNSQETGVTALITAAVVDSDGGTLTHLLDLGAHVDQVVDVKAKLMPVKYMCTALTTAARAGGVQQVKVLLAAGAQPGLADADGVTPLMAAAMGGHGEVIELLLAAGADKDAVDGEGKTAVEYLPEEVEELQDKLR